MAKLHDFYKETVVGELAKQFNYKTEYFRRKNRMNVFGVGEGSAPVDVQATVAVAVQFQEQAATKELYFANIAEGCGENLPAILGLDSMQKKDAVLVLRKGKEFMALPGPGGYQITWSPGTKLISMEHAESGHLVIPCDQFEDLPQAPSSEQISFITDYRQVNFKDSETPTQSSSSSFWQ